MSVARYRAPQSFCCLPGPRQPENRMCAFRHRPPLCKPARFTRLQNIGRLPRADCSECELSRRRRPAAGGELPRVSQTGSFTCDNACPWPLVLRLSPRPAWAIIARLSALPVHRALRAQPFAPPPSCRLCGIFARITRRAREEKQPRVPYIRRPWPPAALEGISLPALAGRCKRRGKRRIPTQTVYGVPVYTFAIIHDSTDFPHKTHNLGKVSFHCHPCRAFFRPHHLRRLYPAIPPYVPVMDNLPKLAVL